MPHPSIFEQTNIYNAKLGSQIKACAAMAKELGFDFCCFTKLPDGSLVAEIHEECGLISVTSGDRPGSWAVE